MNLMNNQEHSCQVAWKVLQMQMTVDECRWKIMWISYYDVNRIESQIFRICRISRSLDLSSVVLCSSSSVRVALSAIYRLYIIEVLWILKISKENLHSLLLSICFWIFCTPTMQKHTCDQTEMKYRAHVVWLDAESSIF